MRVVDIGHLTLTDQSNHTLKFSAANRQTTFAISVLEQDIIRVQMLPDGDYRLNKTWAIIDPKIGDVPIEGRFKDDLSPFSLPTFDHQQNNEIHTLTTNKLTLQLDTSKPRLEWFTPTGECFAADSRYRAYATNPDGHKIYHMMQRWDDDRYYGFGEKAGTLDKSQMRMEMRGVDALGYDARFSDPLYKHVAFYITLVPSLNIAYGLFYDNLSTSVFDMGQERHQYYDNFRRYEANDGDLDYYLIYGPTIEAVVEKFTHMTGRMVLPPHWSLGYLGSTMSYTDSEDAQQQLEGFIANCQQHDIPCDLFHLSSGYTADPTSKKRYVFTWNRDRIPDPQHMTEQFHNVGIRLSANIKPYIMETHPEYKHLVEKGAFIREKHTDNPETMPVWSGGEKDRESGAHLDFTNHAAYQWWQEQVTQSLLDYGIDSTWNDNNEYGIWDDEARCHGFGEEKRFGLLPPLHTLLMMRASYEAQIAHKPDERPFVLTRSGTIGMQRYAQTWSGDNYTGWETLRYNISMGLGMGLSGIPNIGHDIGGFYGDVPSPELFVRWVQNGIFHPRFTIHSWNAPGTPVTEPWMYPDVLPHIRDAIHFRYRLIPYLYSLFFEAHQTGHPIIRPMVYSFQDDPMCHTESFDFMLGSQLLVASVLEENAIKRTVYLPKVYQWCDYHTGEWYSGGQTVTIPAPLERFPLLAIENSIIPLANYPDTGKRILKLFPSLYAAQNSFTLIEDDGISLAHQQGEFTALKFTLTTTPDDIMLDLEISGGYELPYQQITLQLPEGEQRPLKLSATLNREQDKAIVTIRA